MQSNDITLAAKAKGLYISHTLAGSIVLHTSPSGYATMKKKLCIGDKKEITNFLERYNK